MRRRREGVVETTEVDHDSKPSAPAIQDASRWGLAAMRSWEGWADRDAAPANDDARTANPILCLRK